MSKKVHRKVDWGSARRILAVLLPVLESYGASTFTIRRGTGEQNMNGKDQGIIKGYSDGRFKPDAQ